MVVHFAVRHFAQKNREAAWAKDLQMVKRQNQPCFRNTYLEFKIIVLEVETGGETELEKCDEPVCNGASLENRITMRFSIFKYGDLLCLNTNI